jgi:hypothetical protein
MASAPQSSPGKRQRGRGAQHQLSQNPAQKLARQAVQACINAIAQHTRHNNNLLPPFTLRRLKFCDVQECLRALSGARHQQQPTRAGSCRARTTNKELGIATDRMQSCASDLQSTSASESAAITTPRQDRTENSGEQASRRRVTTGRTQHQTRTSIQTAPKQTAHSTQLQTTPTQKVTKASNCLRHQQNNKNQHPPMQSKPKGTHITGDRPADRKAPPLNPP